MENKGARSFEELKNHKRLISAFSLIALLSISELDNNQACVKRYQYTCILVDKQRYCLRKLLQENIRCVKTVTGEV